MRYPPPEHAQTRAKFYFDAVDNGDADLAFTCWTRAIDKGQFHEFIWEPMRDWRQGAFGQHSHVLFPEDDPRYITRHERFYLGLPFSLVEQLTWRVDADEELYITEWIPYPVPEKQQQREVLTVLAPAFYRALWEKDAHKLDQFFPPADAEEGLGAQILDMVEASGQILGMEEARVDPVSDAPNEIKIRLRVQYEHARQDEELNFYLSIENELHLRNWRPGENQLKKGERNDYIPPANQKK